MDPRLLIADSFFLILELFHTPPSKKGTSLMTRSTRKNLERTFSNSLCSVFGVAAVTACSCTTVASGTSNK